MRTGGERGGSMREEEGEGVFWQPGGEGSEKKVRECRGVAKED